MSERPLMPSTWRLVRQCERCKTPVNDAELTLTRRILDNQHLRCHIGCLDKRDGNLMLFHNSMGCLFCKRGAMTMRELIDHFGQSHGRVIANW